MMPDEKTKLLELLAEPAAWCRDAEARDADGEPVTYDSDAAVAWDLTGALCRLFGWRRACVLFPQVDRHVVGKRKGVQWPVTDPGIDAMKSLQDFNDGADTTYEMVRARLEGMPVWTSGAAHDAQ